MAEGGHKAPQFAKLTFALRIGATGVAIRRVRRSGRARGADVVRDVFVEVAQLRYSDGFNRQVRLINAHVSPYKVLCDKHKGTPQSICAVGTVFFALFGSLTISFTLPHMGVPMSSGFHT